MKPIIYKSITFKEFVYLHHTPGTVFKWRHSLHNHTIIQITDRQLLTDRVVLFLNDSLHYNFTVIFIPPDKV